VRAGKGVGFLERWHWRISGLDGSGRAAAGSDGHSRESIRNTHTRAIRPSWEKTRWDTRAQPPQQVVIGALYRVFGRLEFPQATGTPPDKLGHFLQGLLAELLADLGEGLALAITQLDASLDLLA
jgi:hypothetical protein